MKKISLAAFLTAISIFSINAAFAQFGDLKKSLGGGDKPADSATAEQIVSKYVIGSKSVITADAKMLEAVGLKDEAAIANLQAKNLTEGASKDSLEETAKIQTESSKALEAKLTGDKVKMDAASKKLFADGMKDLAGGVVKYVGMSKEVSSFKPSLGSVSGSGKSAIYIVKTLPDAIKNVGRTLKSSIDFAKANDIKVPKEASDATSLL